MADDARDDAAPVALADPPALPVEPEWSHPVQLEQFSGPLDLLLYLVRRAEVDIADIPVAAIADQFIAAIADWSVVDLDSAGEFVLMAATLLELKSRLVAPPPEVPEGEPTDDAPEERALDPRASLIGQLLAYRACKEAVGRLEDIEATALQRLPRQLRELIPEDPDELDGLPLENCDAGALYAAFETAEIRIAGLGPRTVINDDQPLETRIVALTALLRETGEARLSALFAAEPYRVGRVGVLLAALEGARQRLLRALQHEQYGEVFLHARAPEEPVETLPQGEPEPAGRRRRPPLATWHAPSTAGTAGAAPEADADGEAEAPEEPFETDEQRFLRELEEACAVEAVTTRVADLEAAFAAFVAERQAGTAPVPDADAPGTPDPAAS